MNVPLFRLKSMNDLRILVDKGGPPMSLSQNLKRLKELVESVTPHGPYCVEYKIDRGTCLGTGLLKKPDVSVQDAFMSKGSLFSIHQHESIEILTVYRGRLRVGTSDNDSFLSAGQTLSLPRGVLHEVEAIEDTWMIGITVPAEKGYPDARP